MKRFMTKWMLSAAVTVLAAGSASAQILKAEIPFTFQVGDAVMAPGSYLVILSQNAGERHLVWRNVGTRESALAQYSPEDVTKAWKVRGTPLVRFECSGARCALRELWAGFDMPAYRFRSPSLGRPGELRSAVIALSLVKAD